MRAVQVVLRDGDDPAGALSPLTAINPDLVLAFAPSELFRQFAPSLATLFPDAKRIGCSAAIAVSRDGTDETGCVVTAVKFESAKVVEVSASLTSREKSQDVGRQLGESLPKEGLRAVFLLCQGVQIRGSALLAGLNEALGGEVPVVGGLASRREGYCQTWVIDDSGCSSEAIAALGFYGERLRFGYGVCGGWMPFGPARKVTRCEGNVLYELDGEPALAVYRRYLGDYACDLPIVGHFFPFAMLDHNHQEIGLIRSMLAVDEKDEGLKFGDEINPDGYVRMMHASTDRLVSGAETAAENAKGMLPGNGLLGGLILMVSCVGREMVMGVRVEEEVDAVAATFGKEAAIAGFYSFGEVAPAEAGSASKLHNQTVMVAYIDESAD